MSDKRDLLVRRRGAFDSTMRVEGVSPSLSLADVNGAPDFADEFCIGSTGAEWQEFIDVLASELADRDEFPVTQDGESARRAFERDVLRRFLAARKS